MAEERLLRFFGGPLDGRVETSSSRLHMEVRVVLGYEAVPLQVVPDPSEPVPDPSEPVRRRQAVYRLSMQAGNGAQYDFQREEWV